MQGLIDHSLAAAPVWCSRLQAYTHLLTQDLCLRLLAQAFPLQPQPNTPSSQNSRSPKNGGDDGITAKNASDPATSMSYWEGKTLGSVLSKFLEPFGFLKIALLELTIANIVVIEKR